MKQWQPVGIELPAGWKDAVAEAAKTFNCPMRYLWIAAIDTLLSLPDEDLERLVVAYEMIARKNYDELADTKPGECPDLVNKWVSGFASSMTKKSGNKSR